MDVLGLSSDFLFSDSFYQGNKWHKKEEVLSPPELGLLLLLRQLLCSESSYEYDSANVSSLLRCVKYLTPPVLDYCSPLADLAQFLAQLQSHPPQPTKRPGLIIEAGNFAWGSRIRLRRTVSSLAKQTMKTWLDPVKSKSKQMLIR